MKMSPLLVTLNASDVAFKQYAGRISSENMHTHVSEVESTVARTKLGRERMPVSPPTPPPLPTLPIASHQHQKLNL